MPALEGDEDVKLVPEETVAERIKKIQEQLKYFNSKQLLNQTSNIISTNSIWKQFIQIKK